MKQTLFKKILRFSFVQLMEKTLKHIILVGILLFLNSGHLFARAISTSTPQEQWGSNQVTISNLFESYTFLYTVKNPIKEDFKKGNLTIDNEEEEVEAMTSKKIIEKSKLIFSGFTQLSANSILRSNKSLSLYNDIISIHSYNSLYLLFKVFRI